MLHPCIRQRLPSMVSMVNIGCCARFLQNNAYAMTTRTMAGHNKWSKIRHKKASNDKARAASHSKAARAIEAASRACSGDLSDLHLQSAISAGRAVQLPRERMDRAIERGINPNVKEGELILRRYDGMIPTGHSGKVAVILEALTENMNRTAANVRHMVTKIGGELLPTGSNDWLFDHVGLIWITKVKTCSDGAIDNDLSDFESKEFIEMDIDNLLECALEAGATDVDFTEHDNPSFNNEESNHIIVKCEPQNLIGVVKMLQQKGYTATRFENQWLVKDVDNSVTLDHEGIPNFEKFLEAVEEDLDITNVFHNAVSVSD